MKPYKRSTLLLLAAFLMVGFWSGYLTHGLFDQFNQAQVVRPVPYATPVPDAAPEPTVIRSTYSFVPDQPTFTRPITLVAPSPLIKWQYSIAPRETLRFAVGHYAEMTTFGMGRVVLYSLQPFTLNGHQSDEAGWFYTLDYRMVFGEYQTIIIQGENVYVGIIPRATTVVTVR